MARLAYVRHEERDGRARLEGFLRRADFELGPCLDAKGTQGFVAFRTTGSDPVTLVAFRGTSFNPWRASEAHRPLGDIQRLRRVVYLASARGNASE